MTGPDLVVPPTDGPCQAVFTTRTGGLSGGPYASLNMGGTVGDDPADVAANRARVCATARIDAGRTVAGTQVHGVDVRSVGGTDADGRFLDVSTTWPEGDGLCTTEPGVPLAVFGADCLPILLWRRDLPAVAAVHAGWRGLVGGIIDVALAALGPPTSIAAAIGPGIGPCCYPVSGDIRDRFARRFGEGVVTGDAVDLAAAARQSLTQRGVAPSGVWTLATCTCCDTGRWFSFRRDGAPTGRQAGLIWAEPPPDPG
jgi:polyphenol oxidase